MEELDDLKNIWKNKPFEPKLQKEISDMLRGTSQSIISKLKRSIWFELIFTLLAGCILLYYALTVRDQALRWSFISFLVLFLGYIIYYLKKMKLLNHFEEQEKNIRENLNKLIIDLESYIRFYKKSYSILYPIYLFLILLFVGLDRGLNELLESMKEPKMIIYLSFLLLVFLVSSLWFTNWYLNKLYGGHLKKLKDVLQEINDLASSA